MRKALIVLALLIAVTSLGPPALADPGHARPRITRAEFVRPPLKAGGLERLVVIAHDPDSWISEIQVMWQDDQGSGGIIFAHTHCVQDPDFEHPGIRAKLKLDLEFEHAGPYHVDIRAISEHHCESGNDTRISKTIEMDVEVVEALETFVEPDDIDGPLDVLELSQTVVADEATLRNHVVHTVTVEDLGATPLGSVTDMVELSFDTDGDPATFERRVVVDRGADGLLHAEVLDADGALVGEGTVTAEGATLTIDVALSLLGTRVTSYGWFVLTTDASSPTCSGVYPCLDRAPNTGTVEHVI